MSEEYQNQRRHEDPERDAPEAANDVPDNRQAPDGGQGDGGQGDADEFRERYLRAVAELENYRRRAEKERQDTAKFAVSAFARDIVTVLDNLRRGLDSISTEDRKATPALEALASGMELTEREMLATLERHGVERVEPEGRPFDPHLHQAMFEVEDASVPPGTVVQVAQPGYVLHGRLLRPAMVGVAKGGAKEGQGGAQGNGPRVQAPIANEDVAETDGGTGA